MLKNLVFMTFVFGLSFLSLRVVADLEKELVLYFSFEDEKTEMVKDLSGAGNNGIVKGTPNWVSGPKNEFGKAIELKGGEDYIEVPDNDTLDMGDGDFSVTLWLMQAADQVTNPRILSKMPLFATNGPGFELPTVGTSNKTLHINYGMSGKREEVKAAQEVTDEKWHHLVILKEGGLGKIYIDGQIVANGPLTPIDIDNDYPLMIGANAELGLHTMFRGSIDEIAVYSRALTEEEIIEIMETRPFTAVKAEEKLSATWGYIKQS